MPELLILRHAKSDWSTGEADFERPLNDRGKRDATRMGKWLGDEGLLPDFLVSSPAKRARKTALKVARAMDFAEANIHWDASIYEATVAQLLGVLRRCPSSARRVLLIGHNPGLEQLLASLCPEVSTPPDGKLLPTATLAQLRFSDDWTTLRASVGIVQRIVRPRDLAED